MVKTEFGNVYLKPSVVPKKVYPGNDTTIAYSSNATTLENATLQYSTTGWKNATNVEMEIVNNRTCKAIIPGQAAGTFISYRVEACDTVENVLVANGSYSVKYPSVLNISLIRDSISPGKNMTVRGYLTPPAENLSITVYFTSTNKSEQVIGRTVANGTFTATLKLETVGTWKVQAIFSGDNFRYESTSQQLTVKVKEPSILEKYFLYIGGGISAVAVIGVVIYLKKFRG